MRLLLLISFLQLHLIPSLLPPAFIVKSFLREKGGTNSVSKILENRGKSLVLKTVEKSLIEDIFNAIYFHRSYSPSKCIAINFGGNIFCPGCLVESTEIFPKIKPKNRKLYILILSLFLALKKKEKVLQALNYLTSHPQVQKLTGLSPNSSTLKKKLDSISKEFARGNISFDFAVHQGFSLRETAKFNALLKEVKDFILCSKGSKSLLMKKFSLRKEILDDIIEWVKKDWENEELKEFYCNEEK